MQFNNKKPIITNKDEALVFLGARSSNSQKNLDFSFLVEYSLTKNKTLEFKLIGKHYSKNRFNAFKRSEQFKYNSSIKKAFLKTPIYLKDINKYKYYTNINFPKFSKAILMYEFYNPKTRDADANIDTIKFITDCIVRMGILPDDKRTNVVICERECISKEYFVKLSITQYKQDVLYNILNFN